MLCRSLLNAELGLCYKIYTRGLNTGSTWDILTGVCVERLPVVSPPLTEVQKKYKYLLSTIEIEKSLKSDHELRHESDKIRAELLKKENADVDMDAASKITAQDFLDAANEELAQFKFADIVTEADKTADQTSLDRALQRHLVLLTPHSLGKDVMSLLPQGKRKEGETLRQTAERVVQEACGSELNVQFLSNAPCGFYKYKYPSEIGGKVGAKIFFYYANYKSGKVTKCKPLWVTRTEMEKSLPENYKKNVTEFLFDENF